MMRRTLLAGVLLAVGAAAQDGPKGRVEGVDQRDPTVGMPAHIEQVVLPGPKLAVRPLDLDTPVVLRILATYPHGPDRFRYDLEYYGLEPGHYDLTQYLVRADGSEPGELPALEVDVRPVRPPGRVEPNELPSLPPLGLGGYRTLLLLAAILWLVGLLTLLLVGRRRAIAARAEAEAPLTLADRLQPLVEAAQRGELDDGKKAELERLLLAYWRGRLGLHDCKAAEAMVRLRQHGEAGPLLRQLELWLHSPAPHDPVDVEALLSPYRGVSAEAVRGEAS